MVSIRQVRYFLTAIEHGSFRKAAAALRVNESAISRGVRDLEDQLGASLFQRHNFGVSLTVAGEQFARHARKGLRQLEQGANDVGAIGRCEQGAIKIGIFSSLASGFLRELLSTFGEIHTDVQIELIDGNPAEHVASVRQLRLDIAFIAGIYEWSDCDCSHLWDERIYLALPSNHPLAKFDVIEWQEIVAESFIVSNASSGPEIREYLVRRLAEFGRHLDIKPQHVSRDNLLTLVAIGRGLTVTSEATTAAHLPGVVYRPIRDEVLPFSAVWSPLNDNPACRRLLSMARNLAKSYSVDLTSAPFQLPRTAVLSQSPDRSP